MSLKRNYVIAEQIGSGSMATISKAIQKSLERLVAIKQIHPHLSENPEFVERFEREAKAAAHLKHVNIMDIIDFGKDTDGTYFIVVEFISGPTLLKLMSHSKHPPFGFTLSVMIQLLAGLEHAHNNGVIHRDIKPANIMMTPAGALKITDFGVSQAVRLPSITQTGQKIGTPNYMSPEQAEGRKVDHRSDLFSAGIILYHLLSGKAPFEGTTISSITRKLIHEQPAPIQSVNKEVPDGLAAIVDRALAKQPTERYFDAGEFAYALESFAFEAGIQFGPRVCKEHLESLDLDGLAEPNEDFSSSQMRQIRPTTGIKKDRPTAGFLPLQGCFGCQLNLLDLHEKLPALAEMLDIRFSYLMDIKEIPELDIGFVEGAVANVENEERLKVMRERCEVLVALGTCACFGGIPALRNLHSVDEIIAGSYRDQPSNVGNGDSPLPDTSCVPALTDHVKVVSDVVKVDFIIPGCPSPHDLIMSSLANLLDGSQLDIPTHNLCRQCGRKHKEMLNPQRSYIANEIHPTMELDHIDPERCFLEQGTLCLGLATREGCGARCLKYNMPCRGCMGPPPRVKETGAKWIDALGSLLPGGSLRFRHDLVGLGYRYSMAISMMPYKKQEEN